MKDYNLKLIIISILLVGCNYYKSFCQNRLSFLGTTWAMHLKGDSYNFIWLSCDSTFIQYDDEIENHYYGRFKIINDTLILNRKFKDDYHKYGKFPMKKISFSTGKYLIINNIIIELISGDKDKSNVHYSYLLKQRFDCESISDH